jgi:ssDNA-binding protein
MATKPKKKPSNRMPVEKKCTVTHEFRLSYPSLLEPKAFEDQEAKYSCVALFPKETNLGVPAEGQAYSLRRIVKNAKIEMWGKDESEWPENIRSPFRDGDKKKGDNGEPPDGYADSIYCTFSNKKPPGLVDQRRRKIEDESMLYAGCWCRAEVIAFAYDQKGNKGVSLSLQNIQKVRDDDSFSGKRDASDVFTDVEGEEGDEDEDRDEEDGDEEDERPARKAKPSSKSSSKTKRKVGQGGF